MTETFMTALTFSAQAIACLMLGVWVLSLVFKDASIVDVFWSLCFLTSAIAVTIRSDTLLSTGSRLLLFILALWAVRLALHLFIRWRGEEAEDGRYQSMRKSRPHFWFSSLYVVFALQGFLAWIIGMPVTYSLANPTLPLSETPWLIYSGAFIALGGVLIETTADLQLTKFKSNSENQGKILDTGLWARSRHPNYFGDVVFWWGMFILCCGITSNALYFAFAPLMMNYLLVKISGADLLDKILLKRKAGYKAYMAKTNRFIPKLF